MFDHFLEASHQDDSYKWSNIRFGEEITQVEPIEVHFTHLIWSSAHQNRITVALMHSWTVLINKFESEIKFMHKLQICHKI